MLFRWLLFFSVDYDTVISSRVLLGLDPELQGYPVPVGVLLKSCYLFDEEDQSGVEVGWSGLM